MIIQVHDGKFHADDVIFVALCLMEVNDDKISIMRNRDIINPGDEDIIIGDTGYVYNPDKNQFDHHQDDYPVYENGIQYSACGLYLKHMTTLTDEEKQKLLEKALYGVQAHDNGQDVDNGKYPNPFEYIPAMNCNWEEGIYSPEQDDRFVEAVRMTARILDIMITGIRADIKVPGLITEMINSNKRENKTILDIGNYMPWENTVIEYNKNASDIIKVVVYYSSNNQWYIQVVPKDFGTFEAHAHIPLQIGQMEECVFRHKAGFLASFKTHKAALNAANISVATNPETTANALGYTFTW